MFQRQILPHARRLLKKQRAITLLGPRQSGKTTLARSLSENFQYVSLENPDIRNFALHDPRGFLYTIKGNAILDEVQRAPELLSYLQEILDNKKDRRKFILTGSNSLLISDKISQSLAGRSSLLTILPLRRNEIPAKLKPKTLEAALFTGGYPKIYDKKLEPTQWLADYYQTYVEKDVRQILNIGNLAQFDRFIRILASRVGQLAVFSSLASDTGISQPTAVSWLSTLQASYIAFLLQPHFRNFSKRLIKAPKIYFYDTGLLCYLLRITSPHDLTTHPLRGQIFENYVIVETMKNFMTQGQEAPVYFWRDQHGHEVDLVIDKGTYLDLTEVKSARTFHPDFAAQLKWLNHLQGRAEGTIIYGGDRSFEFQNIMVQAWSDI